MRLFDLEKLKPIIEKVRANRKWLLTLSVLVVFITTYMLILPAFTLEKDEAEGQGGIDLPVAEETAAEETAPAEEPEAAEAEPAESEQEEAEKSDTEAEEPAEIVEETSSQEEEPQNTDEQPVAASDGKEDVEESEEDATESEEVTEEQTTEKTEEKEVAEATDPLTYEGENYRVIVEDKGHVLPANTEIKVKEIDEQLDKKDYKKYVSDSIQAVNEDEETNSVTELKFARFYDITLIADGKEIETPKDAVSVRIEYDKELSETMNVEDPESLRVIHFAEDKKTGEIEPEILDSRNIEVNTDKKDLLTDATFEAESFSVYAVVYTVDFSYSVDGKSFEYSMEGNKSISLKVLLETLEVIKDDKDTEPNELDLFMGEVDKVEFTNDELIKIEKTEGDEADWTLTSLKPFDTEEKLTITMKNGDVFEVKVTDAQLKTYVISSKGDKYEVIVTYDDTAEIPEGAELRVAELKDNDKDYSSLVDKAAEQIDKTSGIIEKGGKSDEFKDAEKLYDALTNTPMNPTVLDISIWYDGQEIEPAEGSKVNVSIKLAKDAVESVYSSESSPILVNDEPLSVADHNINQALQVIHNVDDGDLELVDVNSKAEDKQITGEFSTESFSNWLLYLDDEFPENEITVNKGDSLTLRPYGQWYWRRDGEPESLSSLHWLFPTNEYNVTNGQTTVPIDYNNHYQTYSGITAASTKDGRFTFTGRGYYDRNLLEDYWAYNINLNNAGTFNLYVGNPTTGEIVKTIKVTVADGQPSDKPGIVQEVEDIKVNLFDYDNGGTLDEGWGNGYGGWEKNHNLANDSNYNNTTINNGHTFKFLSSGSGNATNNASGLNDYTTQNPHQGLVDNTLVDGYPKVKDSYGGDKLGYLFDTSKTSWDNNSIIAYPNVTGLFQKDTDGYYYYNSNKNYAYYNPANGNKKITLYEHTYTQDTEGTQTVNAKPIGFFPFHDFDSTHDLHVNQNSNLNHHLGMSMTVDFELPKDKKNDGKDIIYEFSGDDDLWVYVDNELVLDIGGIHQPVTGTINFTTGEITVYGKDKITKTFSVGAHTMKMFYLERGGCDSNLSVRFNLPLVKGKAALDIAKKSMLDDATDPDKNLPGAVFGVWETADCSGDPYMTATSDADGHVDFGYLPVKQAGQKFYIKEIAPPDGYLLNMSVFTAVASEQNADGSYNLTIYDSNNQEIEVMEQEPKYPIIRDGRPNQIDLSVQKLWQNTDGTPINPPAGVTAQFEVLRNVTRIKRSTPPAETVTVIIRNNANPSQEFDRTTAHFDDVLTINYKHSQDGNNHANCSAGNGTQNILYMPSNSAGTATDVTYTVNRNHVGNNGTIEIIAPSWFTDWCNPNANYHGVYPHFTGSSSGGGSEEPTIESETYHDDSFSRIIELPNNGTWTNTAADLETKSSDGEYDYYYSYYIKEKSIPEGFEAVYVDDNGDPITDPSTLQTNTGGSQTVINRTLTGALKITKNVTVGGDPVTDANKKYADGTYSFTVTGKSGAAATFGPETYSITIKDGVAQSLTVPDLPCGKYEITEVDPINGTKVVGAKTVTVTVKAGTTGETTEAIGNFTNNMETVDVQVHKVWLDNNNKDGKRPANLKVTLSNGDEVTLNDGNSWTATITGLPKYNSAGELIQYTWTEETIGNGYVMISSETEEITADEHVGPYETTITNGPDENYNPLTNFTGSKTWKDDGTNRPSSITIKLYKGEGDNKVFVKELTIEAPASGSNVWNYEFTNLPVFDDQGNTIEYSVEEVLPNGYVFSLNQGTSHGISYQRDPDHDEVNVNEPNRVMTISTGYNLGFIVIKHGNDFIIWTPRKASADELNEIKEMVGGEANRIGDNEFSQILSRVPTNAYGVPNSVGKGNTKASIYMDGDEVKVDFGNKQWSQLAWGTLAYTYTPGNADLINTQEHTDFEFSKKWIGDTSQETVWDPEVGTIEVTVERKAGTEKDNNFSLVYTITPDDIVHGKTINPTSGGSNALKVSVTEVDGKKKYIFTVDGLDYADANGTTYTYYVTETNEKLEGYKEPSYENTSAPTGTDAAYDEGTIVNTKENGVVLPSAGGIGTTIFYALGTILVLVCGVYFIARRRVMN